MLRVVKMSVKKESGRMAAKSVEGDRNRGKELFRKLSLIVA
jgi:hypothetical protein